ncbi:MAG: thiamine diphosphokinase [Bacillota bacterium]|nr:thiamine diphosphokinase [Bacillota bacterium]
MKSVYLITPLAKKIPMYKDVDYVGVDAGSLRILENHLPLKFCVGDFDSMSSQDFEKLDGYEIVQHPVMKDETDSELAIRLCKERGYEKITLFGAISGRIDHTLSNIRLLMYSFPEVVLEDESQKIFLLKKGKHKIKNDYRHISFFACEKTTLSLSGFLYNLSEKSINVQDIFTVSNSIAQEEGTVEIKSGSVLCIQSNEK